MSKFRIHFLTLLIGISQIYAWATTYYLPATLGEIVSNELHQSYLIIMGGFSWALLVGGLSAPKIGSWIDLKGGQHPLVLGNLLMGSGLLLLSQTNGLLIWYLSWTIIGFGMALGLFNATFATIGRLMGQESKKIIIRVTLISGFATLFWPITTYLIQTVGWHKMVMLYAIPHIFIWAPLFYFSIPNWVPKHTEELTSEFLVVPEKVKLVFYLLATYAILRSIVGTTISVNILNMFAGFGLSVSAAAIVAALIGPSQIVGRLIEMYVGRKFDPLMSSIFWTVVLPISIFILVLAGPRASSFFAVAYGMSNGVLTITMGILPMILFGTKGYAKLLGKLALPVLIAQAATPLLVAPLIEQWPAIRIFILAGILGIAAVLCLVFLSFFSMKKLENKLHL